MAMYGDYIELDSLPDKEVIGLLSEQILETIKELPLASNVTIGWRLHTDKDTTHPLG